jgi:hypothetical protein
MDKLENRFQPISPGLYFTATRPIPEPSPLRTDVAGFIGRTRRGPILHHSGELAVTRVEGWREYISIFGGLADDAVMTYSIRGYFENEGEVAYVIRLCHPSAKTAAVEWKVGELDAEGRWMTADSLVGFRYGCYRIESSSPGAWANDTRVDIHYRSRGMSDQPEIDLSVNTRDEPNEYFVSILLNTPASSSDMLLSTPDSFVEEINARSRLVRLVPLGPPATMKPQHAGPSAKTMGFSLIGGRDSSSNQTPRRQDYLDAVKRLGDQDEVALVAVPGLYDDIEDPIEQREILLTMIEQAEQLRDRLVLVDVPADRDHRKKPGLVSGDLAKTLCWIEQLRDSELDKARRAVAVYHPQLSVLDPLGGIRRPLRSVPPSGHVAGVISRLDRQRGAHHTPANAPVFEAVDLNQALEEEEQVALHTAGVNLLRCFPGNGLQVWGGRTMSLELENRFVAHRRLIHRLVRVIRRVAEPLVFDVNGPEIWLTLARSIMTVLVEAWQAGALKGARPEEAFRVRCDEKLNPPAEQDLGRVYCEIDVAPAIPMEFIMLRVSLSGDGRLEVFEA